MSLRPPLRPPVVTALLAAALTVLPALAGVSKSEEELNLAKIDGVISLFRGDKTDLNFIRHPRINPEERKKLVEVLSKQRDTLKDVPNSALIKYAEQHPGDRAFIHYILYEKARVGQFDK